MPLRLSSLNIKHVTFGRVEGGWGEEEERKQGGRRERREEGRMERREGRKMGQKASRTFIKHLETHSMPVKTAV